MCQSAQGPFNCQGLRGPLKERQGPEWRHGGLSWLYRRLEREMIYKIAAGKGDATLKQKVCPSIAMGRFCTI